MGYPRGLLWLFLGRPFCGVLWVSLGHQWSVLLGLPWAFILETLGRPHDVLFCVLLTFLGLPRGILFGRPLDVFGASWSVLRASFGRTFGASIDLRLGVLVASLGRS